MVTNHVSYGAWALWRTGGDAGPAPAVSAGWSVVIAQMTRFEKRNDASCY
jgi:hypothetical protein